MTKRATLFLSSLPILAATAGAQWKSENVAPPPHWDRFGLPGTLGDVNAIAEFDGGDGARVWVGGSFYATGILNQWGIGRWGPDGWEDPGVPWPYGIVDALCVYDDGDGARLFVAGRGFDVGGSSRIIAAFDGESWETWPAFGVNLAGSALYTDGESLFLGGKFSSVGGVAAKNVARFDGEAWFPVGDGLPQQVEALHRAPTGTLYAGTRDGGIATNPTLYRLVSGSWVAVPGFVTGQVWALASFGGGLVVGNTGKLRIVTASGWQLLGGADAPVGVLALQVRNEGGADVLYLGGTFQSLGGSSLTIGPLEVSGLARFDGEAYPAVPGVEENISPARYTFALGHGSVVTGGSLDALYVGGRFLELGGVVANNVAGWDGSSWSGLEGGQGFQGASYAFAEFDDDQGPAVYVGGAFASVGDQLLPALACWRNDDWEAVPGSPFVRGDVVTALGTWDDGGGEALYVGGSYEGAGSAPLVHRWDGASWTVIGTGRGTIEDFAAFDDGSGEALFVGGEFLPLQGGGAQNLARWDGFSWSSVGDLNGQVSALETWNGALYAAGNLVAAGGVPVADIASWDGLSWSNVGGGVAGGLGGASSIADLLATDLPALGGSRLVAVGDFSQAGGLPGFASLGVWDGASWSPIPGLVPGHRLQAVAVWNDEPVPRLHVAGHPYAANGSPLGALAAWEGGAQWTGSGPNGQTFEALFAESLDPLRPVLWFGVTATYFDELLSFGVLRRVRERAPVPYR